MYSPRGLSTLPARPLDPNLTPGGYMRACRKRAGKSTRASAAAIALSTEDRAHSRRDLVLLERNTPGEYSRLIGALQARAVFPFEPSIFYALAAATAAAELDPWAAL
jgi:hypothetical protein